MPEASLAGRQYFDSRLTFRAWYLYHLVVLSAASVGFFCSTADQAVDGFSSSAGSSSPRAPTRLWGRSVYIKPCSGSTRLRRDGARSGGSDDRAARLRPSRIWHEAALYLAPTFSFANFIKPAMGDVLAGLPVAIVNPSLWTLKIEVAFYLILPGIVALVRGSGRWVLLAILLASIAYRAIMAGTTRRSPASCPARCSSSRSALPPIFLELERYCRGPAARAACLVSAAICTVFWDDLPDALTAPLLGIFVLTFAFALPVIRLNARHLVRRLPVPRAADPASTAGDARSRDAALAARRRRITATVVLAIAAARRLKNRPSCSADS